MRKMMVVLMLAGVLLAGCGGPEVSLSKKYENTANFAADRFEELTVLIKLGAFDKEQLKDIQFWTDQAKRCLDDWYDRLKVDPNSANIDAYKCVREAMLNLLLYQEAAPPELQLQALKE